MKERLRLSLERRLEFLVLIAYVLLSLAFCYPLPLRLTTHVAGRYVDTRIFQWNNWWLKRALLNGLDPNYTDLIYYPSGVSLVSHNINWVSSLISIPLDLLLGPTVAYNLTFLLTFFLSAWAMYLLVRHLTRRRAAAFVAGLAFAFSTYHVSGNFDGQMNLANIQWLPLFILYLLRTMESKKARDAALSGAFFALSSLDCWFFMIFLGIWIALYVVYSLIFEKRKWNRQVWGPLAIATGISLLLMAPFLAPMVTNATQSSFDYALSYHASEKSTDLLAFVLPSSDHPLLSRYVTPTYERFRHWRPAFLGYLTLALAAYAVWVLRRRSILWLLSGLLFATLALGTRLNIRGVEYPGILMPYQLLIRVLPLLKIIRQASRFNVMVTLSLSVLVGLACADLLDRLSSRSPAPRDSDRTYERGRGARHPPTWPRWGFSALVSALILFEHLALPCPLLPSQVPPFYGALAQKQGDFALLELPIDDFHSREYLYPQTLHHKKLVNGYVARAPSGTQDFAYSNPLIKAAQVQMEVDPGLHDIPREIGLLAANDIRYVIIHKQPLPPQPPVNAGVLASWREIFGPQAEYEDAEIVVYRTRLAPDQHLSPVFRFRDRLELAEIRARRARMLAERHSEDDQWLTVDLTWRALSDLKRAYNCRMSLAGPRGTLAQIEPEVISPRYPTFRWPSGVVVSEQYAIPLDPALPAGEYVLSLTVSDIASGEELDTLNHPIQISGHAELLTPALGNMQSLADVTFGQEMWLLGYTAQQEGDRLLLDMYWQALRAMEKKYKIFVHLIRPTDETIVAQLDTMPRNWSYPTSLWARREVFADRIELSVSGVEAGRYRLAVGVYEPLGDRLSALDANDQPIPDNRAILGQTIEVRTP